MFQTHRLAMPSEMLMWGERWEKAKHVLDEALSISIRADDHFSTMQRAKVSVRDAGQT